VLPSARRVEETQKSLVEVKTETRGQAWAWGRQRMWRGYQPSE